MMVCHVSPSGVSGRFIDTTVTIGTTGGGDGSGDGDGITNFGTFLFLTTGSDVLVAFDDWDLLRRL